MLPVHEAYTRFLHVQAHRRCGKTLMAVNWLIKEIITCPNWQPKGAFIGPTLGQAFDAAWAYFLYFTRNIPGVTINKSRLTISFPNGAQIKLFGSTDPDRIKGQFFDAVVLDESAQHPPALWREVVFPMLNDKGRQPGRAMFIGTVKGKNFFWELGQRAISDPDWTAWRFPASKTNIFSQAELEARRREMGDAMYNQEMELDVNASIVGAFLGAEMAAAWNDGRITSPVTYNPAYPVYVSFDLGVDMNQVLWFGQKTRDAVRMLDYYEGNEGIAHTANLIRSKGYSIEKLILPHDGPSRERGSNLSIEQSWRAQGFRVESLDRGSVLYRINAAREYVPQCIFDAKKCAAGVDHLSYFKVAYDERLGASKPQIDKRGGHDHAFDSFSHFALGLPLTAGRYTIDELSSLKRRASQRTAFTNY
jgi:hypothetical protein